MSTVVDNYLSVVDNMILRLFWGGIIEVKYGLYEKLSLISMESSMESPQIAFGGLSQELERKTERLLELLRSFGSCLVAFSGGLDSTVVAKAAYLALGDAAIAVTGISPSMASSELEECQRLAQLIGIRHELIETQELANPLYQRNLGDRCYFCKSELFGRLTDLASRFNVAVVVDGANEDDHGDHRPGLTAAREKNVRSPLAECHFKKSDVRELARFWGLPNWDKPASPCLSSRIAYGEEVTAERLAMIEKAERFLRDCGLRLLRVRYHRGDLARIEVPLEELPRLVSPEFRERLVTEFSQIGFKFVTLDLGGFRSGSLNTLLPPETLQKFKRS
ncbi:MAG TPA: ATP-dependent sacrificial sulfur transferase LarE [Thermogutta sp.]|nr:ATP-dependent sacrificial sulfur transferase LarE [Thermogutta sp.]